MTEEVMKYAEKRIRENNIRMVPGHYPDFASKEHVDMWLKMSQVVSDMNEYEPKSLYLLEMTEVDILEYQKLLDRLKKNKENVPQELLLTKYEKPYNKLRSEIADMTSQILKDIVLEGLRVECEEAVETYAIINQTIAESGVLQEVSHAVYQDQDVDQVLKYAMQLRELVHQKMEEMERDARKKEK